jgi:hypothetical protein
VLGGCLVVALSVFGVCLVGDWWVLGGCLVVFGGCRWVFRGRYLVGVWWVSGGCLVSAWWMFGGCLFFGA